MRPFHSAPGREPARQQYDEYASVKAILANRTDAAILLSREDWLKPVWVPKRRLSIQCRVPVENQALKTEIEVRVELRFALENKLV
jgi:hypothetical protein